MAKRMIMQIMPYDSPGISFLMPKIAVKFELDNPLPGDMQWGRLKSATFDEKRAITRKWHKIDA